MHTMVMWNITFHTIWHIIKMFHQNFGWISWPIWQIWSGVPYFIMHNADTCSFGRVSIRPQLQICHNSSWSADNIAMANSISNHIAMSCIWKLTGKHRTPNKYFVTSERIGLTLSLPKWQNFSHDFQLFININKVLLFIDIT